MNAIKTVNLLWTGGWDSTFRILTLAANENARINIYYVEQPEIRKSTPLELKAMSDILEDIYERFPGSRERICSISHFDFNKIIRNETIRDYFAQLNRISSFGEQYAWLSEFAIMQGIDDFEMSIASNDGRVYKHLENHYEIIKDPIIGEYGRISANLSDDSPYNMFKYFNFPTIMHTKLDMKRIAEENGTFDILNKSWFCFSPKNGKACGFCNPCRCAMEEGMSFRLPRRAQMRYRFRMFPPNRFLWNCYTVFREKGVSGFLQKAKKKIAS